MLSNFPAYVLGGFVGRVTTVCIPLFPCSKLMKSHGDGVGGVGGASMLRAGEREYRERLRNKDLEIAEQLDKIEVCLYETIIPIPAIIPDIRTLCHPNKHHVCLNLPPLKSGHLVNQDTF